MPSGDILGAAMNAGTDGWLIFDAQDRLLFVTQNLFQIADHTEDFEVGISYEALLRRRFRRGIFKSFDGDEEAFVAAQLASRREPEGQSYSYQRPDGRWLMMRSCHMPGGGIVSVYTDITEVKAVEQRAARAEATLRDAISSGGERWTVWGPDERLQLCSEAVGRNTLHPEDFEIGVDYETLIRRRVVHGVISDAVGREDEFLAEQLALFRSRLPHDTTLRRADGIWFLRRLRHTADGCTVETYTDVTEMKAAEHRAAHAERQLRNAIDSIGEAFVLYDREDRLVLWNHRYAEFSAMTIDLLVKGTPYETLLRVGAARGEYHVPPDQIEQWVAEKLERRRDMTHSVFDHLVAGRWLRVIDRRTPEGETVGIRTDVTDLKAAEERARQAEAWLRDAINTSGNVWMIWDQDDKLALHTSPLSGVTPYPEDIEVGVDYETLLRRRIKRGVVAGIAGREEEYVREQMAKRKSQAGQNSIYQRADGRWFMIRSHRMSDGGTVQVFIDVTDLKVAEERVTRAEAWLRDAVNTSGNVWVIWDRDDKLVLHTLDLEGITPHPEDFEIGVDYETFVRRRVSRGVLTIAVGREEAYVQEQLAARKSPEGQNVVYRRPDGHWFMIRSRHMSDGGIVQVVIDVTDVKIAEERAVRAEAWLRDVVKTSGNILVLWDAQDRLVMFSGDIEKTTVNPEDFEIGITYEAFLRRRITRGIMTLATGREEEYVQEQLKARRSPEGQNYSYRRPDGRWFLIRSRRLSDGGVVQSYIDVTDLKGAEERVSRAEQRLRNAVDSMADGFRLWDAEDRLVLYNRAFQAQSKTPEAQETGRTYEETLRMAVARGVIDSARGREEDYVGERLDAHRRADGRPFEMQRADGRWFETREYRTDEGGTVHIRADITERKMREVELSMARDAAEQASRAKSEFLSKMSHDLRTPLNAVLGFSQLLLMERGREALSRQQNEAVATIERTGRHLLSMVEDILDLARIENRAIELTTESLSLAAVCSEVLTLVQPLTEAGRVHISHDVMRPNTPQVLGDRKRVIQVLTNLVSNAIKYGGSGGRVVIAVEPAAGGFVRLGVTDFGPGIPTDRQAQLFQPFSRLGQESSTTEGTGIGLTIAKGLVERMGGTIGVYSVPHEATTFWFSLPEAVASAAAPGPSAPRGDEIAQVRTLHQVGPATILYIEDTLENLTLVRRLLSRFANIRYLEAETAELGIEIARRERPDVVLMDMRLPGMSGIAALAVLRADPATQGMTVIGLTGAAMPHEAQEIKVAGFDGYITKPFRIAALLEALVQALDRGKRRTG